jgi:ATP-GRASP peptide maturase of grasp-with-spasm system
MSDKAIIIVSEENDFSTSNVIEWLLSRGAKVYCLNVEDSLRIKNLDLKQREVTLISERHGEILFSPNTIKAFWYRRGDLSIQYSKPVIPDEWDILLPCIMESFHEGATNLKKVIYTFLQEFKSIGNFDTDCDVNKLANLRLAELSGFGTPDSYIITSRTELIELLERHEKLVVKPYTEGGLHLFHPDYYTHDNTLLITNASEYPENFQPTLIQEYIEKRLELRIFYLDGEFFSSAIFSQLDEQTKIDFRNYNHQRPVRTIPFRLPKEIEIKLLKLMTAIGLDSGSIDLILTSENKYVFLEVNPVGQFHQVSYPCNYYLEKVISEKLIYA